MKASFLLDIDELAAVVGFLNAKGLVGLGEELFSAFSEANVPVLMEKLEKHGLMRPGERKGTWHINEDLMQTAAVAIAPQFAVLVRSAARGSSIVFYLADREITEVVVGDRAMLAYLDDLGELCAETMKFLGKHFPAEVVVARVKGDGFDKGYKVEIGADGAMRAKSLLQAEEAAWTRENLEGFVRRALSSLGARLGGGS